MTFIGTISKELNPTSVNQLIGLGLFFVFFLFNFSCFAQSFTIKGTVFDNNSRSPLNGVNISIQNTFQGTYTDINGKYSLEVTEELPFTLVFSMIGYSNQKILIETPINILDIHMEEEAFQVRDVVVSASRMEEALLESPVSIEKLDIRDLKRTTAANFYDGIYNLKGVDMNVQSLTFRTLNTRGFNGNTNYRFNQFTDGMDNTPAGLGFAAGNIFGLSQLDVESVELLIGASSALYGPGGMNGSLLMTSKNPFEYQGLSASLQTGIMHMNAEYRDNPSPMVDLNLRYAKSFKDKFAFKVVLGYLQANDWHASDYRDRNNLGDPNSTRESNEGYDGVNVYGDDIIVPVNLKEVAPEVAAGLAENFLGLQPGTPEFDYYVDSVAALFPDQIVSRTGWKEKDLVDYNTKNLRILSSLNYRFSKTSELILSGGFGSGTSVYTAQNRFSLKNFSTYMGKLELKKPEGFLRLWTVGENAGDTYDAGTTGLLLNEAWKSSEDWYADYLGAFAQGYVVFGFPLNQSYSFARTVADNRNVQGNIPDPSKPAFPLAGTEEFNSLLNDITSTSLPSGSLIVDKTSQIGFEGMYNFNHLIKAFELIVGWQYRYYNINTEGTTFLDEKDDPLHSWWYGIYAQIRKDILKDHLRITFSSRFDDHQQFESIYTPRFSMVYSMDKEKNHTVRASLQSAFRYASLADQWVDLNIGAFQVIGGLPQVFEKYGITSDNVYPLTGSNPITDKPYLDDGPINLPVFRPEKVTAYELGYRGLYFKKQLFVDFYVFQNIYNGFHSRQLMVKDPNTPEETRFQTTISSDSRVTANGWALSGDFRFINGIWLKGNISYNGLSKNDTPPGFSTRFNTPDYRLNLGLGKTNIINNISANVNWRWQNDFYWESSFGDAAIPSFNTLDAMVGYKLPKIKTSIKIGGSNILNKYYTTAFGNAQIGGLYYITLEFDEMMR
ncbi:TonB-dependent receptor [Echinicola shivajiensis]|uniref:TonB-dependent receptor n=1 Tax=Echinicola shivajiensis TaxID=1035916 RepID=UPI001BFC222E|nr:TonB-dependent receptor [Echinicola shivajiensis]